MKSFESITEAEQYLEKEVHSGATYTDIFMAKSFPLIMKTNLEISRKLSDIRDSINLAKINSHSDSHEGAEQQANRTGDEAPESLPLVSSFKTVNYVEIVPEFEKFLEENRTSVMYFSTDHHRDYFRKNMDESVIPESAVREFFMKVCGVEKK